METTIFYIIFSIIILSALFILFTKNVVYAAFALLLTFTGIAGIYVFLIADVVAVAQLMVYVGGILILLIFGIMFTSKGQHNGTILTEHQHQLGGGLLSISIACLLFLTIFNTNFENLVWIKNATILSAHSTVELVGLELMTDNVLALEIVGVLLLLALIGTALIAGKKIIN